MLSLPPFTIRLGCATSAMDPAFLRSANDGCENPSGDTPANKCLFPLHSEMKPQHHLKLARGYAGPPTVRDSLGVRSIRDGPCFPTIRQRWVRDPLWGLTGQQLTVPLITCTEKVNFTVPLITCTRLPVHRNSERSYAGITK